MEEPFYNNPRKLRKVGGFYYLYGQTDAGRRLFEVFIMKGHTARVISARDMDKEERNIYERWVRAMEEKKRKLPEFKTEEEVREFWDTHSSADYVDEMEEVKEPLIVTQPRKRQVTVRLDDPMIDRIKKLANRKGMPWQTLMRSWVYERLEDEEKRAG